ncbi:hypothetical protein [Streptomyces sp. NPDC020951]|uniref:hypothetical protein n=1 Tax=Streptomyces sp. NPDC020951 TaxID=3365104 RepID=UPI0037945074
MTMTPGQVLTVAALGGAAGVLAIALLAALSYGTGILACRAFDYLFEKRQQRHDRRAQQARSADLDACHALPAHDPRDPR